MATINSAVPCFSNRPQTLLCVSKWLLSTVQCPVSATGLRRYCAYQNGYYQQCSALFLNAILYRYHVHYVSSEDASIKNIFPETWGFSDLTLVIQVQLYYMNGCASSSFAFEAGPQVTLE
jgi:hypothetical protein